VNSYPATEKMIWEVERGRTCTAVLPMPPGMALSAGDSILFAAAYSHDGRELSYSMGGDSVRVLLTGVSDLGTTDPVTGQALFRLSWKSPAQDGLALATTKRSAASRGSKGRA
jgi:hypothetical protein